MARSKYIYVAVGRYDDIIVCGTVKRDVIACVKRHYAHITWDIRRYNDCPRWVGGPTGKYTSLDAKDWHSKRVE